MKKLLSLLFMAGMLVFAISCGSDDDVTPDGPSVTAAGATEVKVGQTATLSFTVAAPGGYASAEVTATGGEAEVTSEPASGATSGNVEVEFTAGNSQGAASVTLVVTDANGKEDEATAVINVTAKPTAEVFVSPDGIGTTTWSSDSIYIIRGFVYVNNGQTLTIEPGTVIKGQPGQGAGASALIVARGGTIIAEGTAEEPIIFTALEDDTDRTDDLPFNSRGLWGGVIILGNAYINHANGQTNIEGIPADASETRSLYGVGADTGTGGTTWTQDNAHNAGIMKYVSIRHGGTNIGAGNEINGLTMGGVGSGTTIEYVEVFGNDDDGFEWFGGTVNSRYLASIFNQDDSYDFDFGWRGENQFWVAAQELGFAASDRGFESDGAHSGNLGAAIFTQPQIYNLTLIGQGATGNSANAIYATEGFAMKLHNSIVMNFARGINLTDVGATGANSRDRLANGDLVFKNNIFYNIAGTSTTLDLVASSDGAATVLLAALSTHLAANSNEVGDPGISVSGSGEASSFSLLPAAGSLALTKTRSEIPAAAVNGFTYTNAEFVGAFGSENWLEGWSAASAYGLLGEN